METGEERAEVGEIAKEEARVEGEDEEGNSIIGDGVAEFKGEREAEWSAEPTKERESPGVFGVT